MQTYRFLLELGSPEPRLKLNITLDVQNIIGLSAIFLGIEVRGS